LALNLFGQNDIVSVYNHECLIPTHTKPYRRSISLQTQATHVEHKPHPAHSTALPVRMSSFNEAQTGRFVNDESAASAIPRRALPRGRLSDQTKRRILVARKRCPRYIFRYWCNSPICPSGGAVELNSKDAIVPLAFHRRSVKPPKTIFDLTDDQLNALSEGHLTHRKNLVTVLSSWTANLRIAIDYAMHYHEKQSHHCYISALDTSRLGKKNCVVYVPDLYAALGKKQFAFPHECLAYGVIPGRAYRTVPLSVFLQAGFGLEPFLPVEASVTCKGGAYPGISKEELERAVGIGKQFGEAFMIPVTIAILSLHQRDDCLWRCNSIKNLNQILEAIHEFDIPGHSLSKDATIMTDIVYTENAGEVEQMIRLLRAVVRARGDLYSCRRIMKRIFGRKLRG
jgi:hypothetical protein